MISHNGCQPNPEQSQSSPLGGLRSRVQCLLGEFKPQWCRIRLHTIKTATVASLGR